MDVNIALIDDDRGHIRIMEKLIEEIGQVDLDGEAISFSTHEISLSKLADGNLDVRSIATQVQRINANVVIVDLRLLGDDPKDFSGVDLSLMIKAMCADCCIILVSAFLHGADAQVIQDLAVFRHQIDKSEIVPKLQESVKEAVKTHRNTLLYRQRRFATSKNCDKKDMWGLVLEPKAKGVHFHRSVPLPFLRSNSVVVRTREIGVCGTDHHAQGAQFEKPYELIDFHEAFGEVVWIGESVRNLAVGDLVVPMVRRCETWLEPANGQEIHASSWGFQPCEYAFHRDCTHQADRCPKGRFDGKSGVPRIGYCSRGTGKCHGFGTQYFVDTEDWLVKITKVKQKGPPPKPEMHRRYVLTEPLSIVWKVRRQILKHRALHEFSDRLLIVGIGPIGLLAALVMHKLHPGLKVSAIDLANEGTKRVKLLKKYLPGVQYYKAREHDCAPEALRKHSFDLIIEATTEPQNVLKYAPSLLATDGILALLGIRDKADSVELLANDISELVRRGNVVIGSVNSSRVDFEESIDFLQLVSWPESGLLEEMVERWRINSASCRNLCSKIGGIEAWKRDEIKVVLIPDEES